MSQPELAGRKEWIALGVLALPLLLVSMDVSVLYFAVPFISADLGVSATEQLWIFDIYGFVLAGLLITMGSLGDRIGRRRLLLAGILAFTAASAGAAVAPALGWLIAARLVQGAGAAAMLALPLAIAPTLVPPGQTGRVMGLLGTMSAAGTALGPSLGGALLAGFGWPALFLANVPLGLLATGLAGRYLPAEAPVTRAAGAAGTSFWVQAWRQRDGLGASLAAAAVVMATLVVGPFYLAGALGLAPAQVGLVMSVGPLVAALGGVPAGRLVDRHGARAMTFLGLFGMAAGALGLALPAAPIVAAYVAPLAVLTGGYALFQAANNTAMLAEAPAGQRGLVSGLLTLARNLGLILGAAGLGAVFTAGAGVPDPVAGGAVAIAAGTRAAFAGAAGLLAGAIALMASRRAEVAA